MQIGRKIFCIHKKSSVMDQDSTYHPDADPDPDLGFQIKAQTFAKVLIFHSFWLVICKIDADPVRIQHITLMRIRILIFI
jgi:hypothetical protein